ncbi:hypothetical protein IMSAGC018_01382 [Lachnospiraceae bacterium]|nr:hypothetical protein IMSAGC018_01382 [Lachnospiraceae bacterium]
MSFFVPIEFNVCIPTVILGFYVIENKKLTAKVDGQQKQISRITDKVMEQSYTIDQLQEKATDLGRLERHLGRE